MIEKLKIKITNKKKEEKEERGEEKEARKERRREGREEKVQKFPSYVKIEVNCLGLVKVTPAVIKKPRSSVICSKIFYQVASLSSRLLHSPR